LAWFKNISSAGEIVGRSIAIAVFAAALSLAGSPTSVHAAGLGKLTVLSALGQPLVAEIDIVSLQRSEEDGLSARLASPDAFRQAGIEYGSSLLGMRFDIVRRDGRPVLRVSTPQPLNEPFVDMLVELQWNSGRLIREYTFLLDPPEYKAPPAVAAAPAAPAREQPAPSQTQQSLAAPIEAKPLEPATAAAAPTPPQTPGARQYEVRRGDTLGKIARENMLPGMTLEQMLIVIFRANQDAFIRDNVNLVREGRILNIPEDNASVVEADEARRLVRSHNADFNSYRSRVAGAAPAADATPGAREVTGRIEAKPEPAPPAQPQDQVRLSKVEPGKPAAAGSRAAAEDDRVARERALEEAQSRQAELEKNLADMEKLLALRNQQLAELEKRASAKPAPSAAVSPPATASEAPQPAAPVPAAEAPKPAAEASPTAAESPKPAPAAPVAEKPKPAPKKAAPPPPQPEPSLLDEFLDNPFALPGLVIVLLLLAGYGAWAWRRKKASQARFQDSVLDAASGAGAASVFGTAEGGAASPDASQVSVSQAPAGMEAEEVDPIAEADVYMAYGRDAQAEEILKEAVAKDASRTAVHAKLLEIYANRRDARSFEQTALKLKSLTGGTGPEWDKAAALGRTVDPKNGLYSGGGVAAPAVAAAAAVGAAAGAASGAAAAPALDFDLGGVGGSAPTPDIALDAPKAQAPSSIDFDLGAAAGAPLEEKSDFTPEGTLIMGKEADSTASGGGLDFDLGLPGESKPQPAAAAPDAPADTSGGLDFDLNLDVGGGNELESPAETAPAMDLSSISLDLGDTSGETSGGDGGGPKWQEVATKLDLAKAYEEMGDKDGARELLNEVVKDGDAAQKGQAQQLLAKLA
jgi:pilus assembly protein FimV